MHYVYLTNNVVTDQAQIDPFTIFNSSYAEQFIKAPDEVTFNWTLKNGEWIAPLKPDIKAQNKQQAEELLRETDWTATIDIANSEYSNPYLTNQAEFLTYRNQVRAIAINPPTTPADFPNKPQELWS
jgi:hypothetical protein